MKFIIAFFLVIFGAVGFTCFFVIFLINLFKEFNLQLSIFDGTLMVLSFCILVIGLQNTDKAEK